MVMMEMRNDMISVQPLLLFALIALPVCFVFLGRLYQQHCQHAKWEWEGVNQSPTQNIVVYVGDADVALLSVSECKCEWVCLCLFVCSVCMSFSLSSLFSSLLPCLLNRRLSVSILFSSLPRNIQLWFPFLWGKTQPGLVFLGTHCSVFTLCQTVFYLLLCVFPLYFSR